MPPQLGLGSAGVGAIEGLEALIQRRLLERAAEAEAEQRRAQAGLAEAQAGELGARAQALQFLTQDLSGGLSAPQTPSEAPGDPQVLPGLRMTPQGLQRDEGGAQPMFRSGTTFDPRLDETRPPDTRERLILGLAKVGASPSAILGEAQMPFATELGRSRALQEQQAQIAREQILPDEEARLRAGTAATTTRERFDPIAGRNVEDIIPTSVLMRGGGSTTPAPLSAENLNRLQASAAGMGILERMRPLLDRLLEKNLVGGLFASARGGQAARSLVGASGLDPDFAEMEQMQANLLSEVTRLISGAQVSEAEAQRILNQVPNMNKSPDRLLPDWELTVLNMTDLHAAMVFGVPYEQARALREQAETGRAGRLAGRPQAEGVQIEILPEP